MTTDQAARLLNREPSRIRQRLASDRRLQLGFHRRSGRRQWCCEAAPAALTPGREASPLALLARLTDPQEHLDGQSKVKTLTAGADVDPLLAEMRSFSVLA